MKKFLTMLLAALLCVCMCAPAMAETGAELVRTYSDSPYLIAGTNRIKYNNALADLELNPLTEEHYSAFMHQKGWITANDSGAADPLNNQGVMDTDGNIIVPFEYADLLMRSHEWIIAIKLGAGTSDSYDYTSSNKTEFFLITCVDVYNTAIGKVASLTRDQYIDSTVSAGHLAIQDRTSGVITLYDSSFNAVETLNNLYSTPKKALDKLNVFRQDRLDGLKDGNGNIILEPTYKYITLYNSNSKYATFETMISDNVTRIGLLRTADGSVVVPAVYDKIERVFTLPVDEVGGIGDYNAHGYFSVVLDNKVGFVDINGKETVAPRYAKEIVTLNGASYSLNDLTGATLIVAGDGVETVVSGYQEVRALDYCSGIFYQVRTNDGKYGIIDWHGKEILPAVYEYNIKVTGDGQYVIAQPDYKSSELYKLSYSPEALLSADGESAAETTETSGESSNAQGTESASQSSSMDNVAQPSDAAANPAADLIDNVIQLLETDAAANGPAAVAMLNGVKLLLTDGNAAAAALIDSAIALIISDASANASSIITVLQTAKTMM